MQSATDLRQGNKISIDSTTEKRTCSGCPAGSYQSNDAHRSLSCTQKVWPDTNACSGSVIPGSSTSVDDSLCTTCDAGKYAATQTNSNQTQWTFEPNTEVVRGPGWTPSHASLTSEYPRDNKLYTKFGTIDMVQDTDYSSIDETFAWEYFKDDNCKQEVQVMWDGIDETDAEHISSYFVNCDDTPDPIQPRCLAKQHTSETCSGTLDPGTSMSKDDSKCATCAQCITGPAESQSQCVIRLHEADGQCTINECANIAATGSEILSQCLTMVDFSSVTCTQCGAVPADGQSQCLDSLDEEDGQCTINECANIAATGSEILSQCLTMVDFSSATCAECRTLPADSQLQCLRVLKEAEGNQCSKLRATEHEQGVFIRADGGNGETLVATGGAASATYIAPWFGILCGFVTLLT